MLLLDSFVFFLVNDASNLANNTTKSWLDMLGMIGQFFLLIAIFGIVVFLAYYSTKLIGKAGTIKKGRNIEIIEAAGVGYQSTVQLIRVGTKYCLIGVTKEKITFLTDVDPDAVTEQEKNSEPITFQKYFAKYLSKSKGVEVDEQVQDNSDEK